MIYLDKEFLAMFDVDDTIIMHNKPGKMVTIENPYQPGKKQSYAIHETHVNILKDLKARGYQIVVWSANGARWARAAVNALELTDYVDVVMSKPQKFVDDKPADVVLGSHIYIPYKESYEKVDIDF